MAYTTTITFPVQNISLTETIQLILEFNTDLTGANRAWDSKDYNLRVLNYGERKASYDLEDPLMVPGNTSMVIGDPDAILEDILFGSGAIALATDKQAKVTKKINGVAVFIGNMLEDTIEYDDATLTLKFTAAPKTDILTKQMIFDDEDASTAWVTSNFTSNTYYSVYGILETIFHLVNPDIYMSRLNIPESIYVQQGWEFAGGLSSLGGIQLWDLTWYELQLNSDLIFFSTATAQRTVGEVLKKLAMDFGCFAGMVSYDKAFFKQLFSYNVDNLQTVDVISRKKSFRYGLLDYVKVTSNFDVNPNEPYTAGTYTELEDRVLLRTCFISMFIGTPFGGSNLRAVVNPGLRDDYAIFSVDGAAITVFPTEGAIYTAGVGGAEYTVKGTFETVTTDARLVMQREDSGSHPTSGTFYKISGTGDATIAFTASTDVAGTYSIFGSRDPINIDSVHREFGDTLAKFWYATRGNMQNCRVDKFILRGITYDFLKDFNYDGSKYQPIQMKWNDAEGITECEAIYLGEL